MTMSSDRDTAINSAINDRVEYDSGQRVSYYDLREKVRQGNLGGLDRDGTWEAISDAVESFDYDISEGHSSSRGTLDTDTEDSKRLNGLLGEFEKKFGLPDHWKWGPVGSDGYDYDGEGASQSNLSPSLSLDGVPAAPRSVDTLRDEVNQYKDAQDRERDADRICRERDRSMEYQGVPQEPSYAPRGGRGRMRY